MISFRFGCVTELSHAKNAIAKYAVYLRLKFQVRGERLILMKIPGADSKRNPGTVISVFSFVPKKFDTGRDIQNSKFKKPKFKVQRTTVMFKMDPVFSPAIWVKPEQFVWAQGLWDEIRCQKTRKMSTSTSDLWSLHRKIRRLAVKHQVSVELLTSYLTIYTSNIPDQNDQHRRSSTIYRVHGLINLSAVHPTHFEMSFDASTRGSGSPTSVTAHLNRRPFCLKALSYSSADFLDENVLTPALTTRDNSTLSCKYTDCANNSILRSSWVMEINCLKQTGSIFEVWKMLILLVNLISEV